MASEAKEDVRAASEGSVTFLVSPWPLNAAIDSTNPSFNKVSQDAPILLLRTSNLVRTGH